MNTALQNPSETIQQQSKEVVNNQSIFHFRDFTLTKVIMKHLKQIAFPKSAPASVDESVIKSRSNVERHKNRKRGTKGHKGKNESSAKSIIRGKGSHTESSSDKPKLKKHTKAFELQNNKPSLSPILCSNIVESASKKDTEPNSENNNKKEYPPKYLFSSNKQKWIKSLTTSPQERYMCKSVSPELQKFVPILNSPTKRLAGFDSPETLEELEVPSQVRIIPISISPPRVKKHAKTLDLPAKISSPYPSSKVEIGRITYSDSARSGSQSPSSSSSSFSSSYSYSSSDEHPIPKITLREIKQPKYSSSSDTLKPKHVEYTPIAKSTLRKMNPPKSQYHKKPTTTTQNKISMAKLPHSQIKISGPSFPIQAFVLGNSKSHQSSPLPQNTKFSRHDRIKVDKMVLQKKNDRFQSPEKRHVVAPRQKTPGCKADQMLFEKASRPYQSAPFSFPAQSSTGKELKQKPTLGLTEQLTPSTKKVIHDNAVPAQRFHLSPKHNSKQIIPQNKHSTSRRWKRNYLNSSATSGSDFDSMPRHYEPKNSCPFQNSSLEIDDKLVIRPLKNEARPFLTEQYPSYSSAKNISSIKRTKTIKAENPLLAMRTKNSEKGINEDSVFDHFGITNNHQLVSNVLKNQNESKYLLLESKSHDTVSGSFSLTKSATTDGYLNKTLSSFSFDKINSCIDWSDGNSGITWGSLSDCSEPFSMAVEEVGNKVSVHEEEEIIH